MTPDLQADSQSSDLHRGEQPGHPLRPIGRVADGIFLTALERLYAAHTRNFAGRVAATPLATHPRESRTIAECPASSTSSAAAARTAR
jgi:hypothetical protein